MHKEASDNSQRPAKREPHCARDQPRVSQGEAPAAPPAAPAYLGKDVHQALRLQTRLEVVENNGRRVQLGGRGRASPEAGAPNNWESAFSGPVQPQGLQPRGEAPGLEVQYPSGPARPSDHQSVGAEV